LKIVDAVWIWTEAHSLRLQIKLTIQKEVVNGAILQQATVVEYIIRNQQCKTCQSYYAQGVWQAVVQVRQHVSHKRTFYYLEQLLLKNNAHADCLQIMTFNDGMDFYFQERQQGLKFVDFLESHVPIKLKYTKKLLTADHKSNTGKFKHNLMVTIAPLCKDDLVLLPVNLARNLSDISPLTLVKTISAGIQVVDPFTGE
ncbi:nmd3, partial [Symbiodinium microadriaticum]